MKSEGLILPMAIRENPMTFISHCENATIATLPLTEKAWGSAVPGIDATHVWCTLPQTVEFNWDTDGINFVVLTLPDCAPGFPCPFFSGSCLGTVKAASHGAMCTDTSRSDPAFPSACAFSCPRFWLGYSYRNISTAGWIALDFFRGWE